jgi:hypothetical protein
MAGKFFAQTAPGLNLYITIRQKPLYTAWNGSTMEAYSSGNYANYDIAVSEEGVNSGTYSVDIPASLPAGVYRVVLKRRVGASPSESDPVMGGDDIVYDGTDVVEISLTNIKSQLENVFNNTALTEAYVSLGATGTPAKLLYSILQALTEFSISGTTITVKQRDRTTTAKTFTLNDGTNPTSRTEAS